ncbi:MAG: chloride channel protein, partial [Bdellovibrionales bacterium]|nr:chloride channel protein [Bdellovibrionales bacterium]
CLIVILSGLLFGLTSRLFVSTTHLVQKAFSRMSPQIYLQPFFGGLILIGLYYIEGSYDYVGLGLSHIQSALISASNWKEPVLKMIFTSLTVGSGFKGGEFIPLVFMGTTLGSALSFVMPISLPLLARLGFASVFAGAANTPIACSIMAVELFGYEIAPYALLACFSSYFISGHKGIYHSQRIHARKYRHLKLFLNCTHLFGRKNKKDSS